MAGDWIAVDVTLDQKVEVWEICDLTGCDIETVVYRLYKLWTWFQLHSEDGNAKVTVECFSHNVCGDVSFWEAVAQVGWLRIQKGMLSVPGWDERFSGAAKARQLGAKRQKRFREKTVASQKDNAHALPEKKIRDKKRKDNSLVESTEADSPEEDSIFWSEEAGWTGITEADKESWRIAYPATNIKQELQASHQWLLSNPAKAKKKLWRRFLTNWLKNTQEKGGSRGHFSQPAKANRKYFRSEFQKGMTDAEYKAATGSLASDLSSSMKVRG